MADSNLQTTDMEQWEQIAEAMAQVEKSQRKLLSAMVHDGNVPKTIYRDQLDRLSDSSSKLKSELENRMFKEHPEEAEVTVFYGND